MAEETTFHLVSLSTINVSDLDAEFVPGDANAHTQGTGLAFGDVSHISQDETYDNDQGTFYTAAEPLGQQFEAAKDCISGKAVRTFSEVEKPDVVMEKALSFDSQGQNKTAGKKLRKDLNASMMEVEKSLTEISARDDVAYWRSAEGKILKILDKEDVVKPAVVKRLKNMVRPRLKWRIDTFVEDVKKKHRDEIRKKARTNVTLPPIAVHASGGSGIKPPPLYTQRDDRGVKPMDLSMTLPAQRPENFGSVRRDKLMLGRYDPVISGSICLRLHKKPNYVFTDRWMNSIILDDAHFARGVTNKYNPT